MTASSRASTGHAARRSLRVWASTWAVGGAVIGGVLAMGEPGHVPRPLIPFLLAAVGALAGLVAGAIFRLVSPRVAASPVTTVGAAAISGLAVGLGLWRFGLGTPALPSAVAGGLLALIAHWLERRPAGDAR